MYRTGKLLFLYSESLVHPGAGEGIGAIDLPIQREKVTHWPIIWATTLKGAMRDHFEGPGCKHDELFVVFGPDSEKKDSTGRGDPSEYGGAITFGDAQVLLFPVRSLKGTFAYVTCPLAVSRLHDTLAAVKHVAHDLIDEDFETARQVQHPKEDEILLCEENSALLTIPIGGKQEDSALVVLEEMSFKAKPNEKLNALFRWLEARWPRAPWLDLKKRLAMVNDEVFGYLAEQSTEVVTRNRIDDEKGTVLTGALWTEEHLPRETLLYASVLAADPHKTGVAGLSTASDVLDYVCNNHKGKSPVYLWLGGDQSVGRGVLRSTFA